MSFGSYDDRKKRSKKTKAANDDFQSPYNTQPVPTVKADKQSGKAEKKRSFFLRWYDALLAMLDRQTDHGQSPSAIFEPRKRPPHFVLSVMATTVKLSVVFILIFCFIGGGMLLGVAKAYVNTAPDLDLDVISDVSLASQIYDVNGNLLTTYSGTQNRLWASYDEIPQNMINALIATEDARFYSHHGVDLKRIIGSFIGNLTSSSTQGGSTITQQLIKNRMLTPERSYKRKIQEAYLALQLESKYSKEQILEAYLNDVYLSQGNYGVKSAAKDYFGKELSELTLRECAMLVGMVQSPSTYDPRRNYYERDRAELTDNRTATVLSRMYREGYISYEEYQQALNEKTVVREERTTSTTVAASFIDYMIDDIISQFIKARGLEDTSANRNAIDQELRTGGYLIYSTIDPDVQSAMEDAVYNYDNYPKMRNASDSKTTETLSDGSVLETIQPQASAVVYDYKTGEIRGMIGGRTAPSGLKVWNRAVDTHMPIGSSIKPIAVYGPAIDSAGLGAGTIIQNIKGRVNGWDTAKGYPYAGSVDGPVTMRTAIQKSLNLSAARTLMEMMGENPLDTSWAYLEKLGINMDPDYIKTTPAGLALGVSGISSLDLTVAYGAIGNEGEYISPTSFLRVEDANHNVLLDGKANQTHTQVFQPSTAWMLVDMMTTAVQSGTGSRAKVSGLTVAGKTGTNDNNTTFTFAGITPYYSCAVWIGHDGYRPMRSTGSGGTYAAPLFSSIMTKIQEKKNAPNKAIIESSPESLGLRKVTVCQVSGMLATEACSLDAGGLTPVTDWFLASSAPDEPCTYHVAYNFCNDTGKIATPYCTNVTQKAYVQLPADSVLNIADLTNFWWYIPYNSTNPGEIPADKLCPTHTESSALNDRNNAISSANSILTVANARVQARQDQLTAQEQTDYDALVLQLQTLINNPESTAQQITEAARLVEQKGTELMNKYPL